LWRALPPFAGRIQARGGGVPCRSADRCSGVARKNILPAEFFFRMWVFFTGRAGQIGASVSFGQVLFMKLFDPVDNNSFLWDGFS
jgi:hypothetical protein